MPKLAPKKVALTSIKSLTFYADRLTASRRTDPIPQLTCEGSACDLYQPEVVQCVNMGDDGLGGVQWRCDTDLPSSLRLGRTDVSCEGWSGPGDKNVLQGSCGLTYNLHRVSKGLEYGEGPRIPSSFDRLIAKSFNAIFLLIFSLIVYSVLRSLIARFWPHRAPPHISRFLPFLPGPDGGSGGWRGGGGGGGGGPGFNPGSGGSGGGGGGPPPYTKFPQAQTQPSSAQTQTQTEGGQGAGWNPGFWTGLAAGGVGTYLLNQNRQNNPTLRNRPAEMYNRNRRFDDDDTWDRGVGPSYARERSLGETRRATGFGGSSTR